MSKIIAVKSDSTTSCVNWMKNNINNIPEYSVYNYIEVA